MEVQGGAFTVVGAGRSGRAAANALARRGANVRLTEARAEAKRPEALAGGVEFVAGSNAVRPGDVAVLSPGISEVSPVRSEVAAVASEVIGEVELFWRLSPAREVVAITGTDGKSTTTTMIGAIARASGRPTFVGGNLGNPLCEALDDPDDPLTAEHLVVAEISAFQLTTCVDLRPKVAVVTNIAEDHLDYHGGFQPYQAAKRRVWARMGEGDLLLVPRHDPFIARWPLPEGPTIRWFGAEDTRARPWVRELPLLGAHNVLNALAASAAMEALGVDDATARDALMAYRALPHRLEPVGEVRGVRWINDSKATNPNAAAAGLSAVADEGAPVIVICGGSSKDADFGPFGRLIRGRARLALCNGQTGPELARAIGAPKRTEVFATMEEAFARAAAVAEPGDLVLLGPACASFDQFRSYGHRGEVFRKLVKGLGRKEGRPEGPEAGAPPG